MTNARSQSRQKAQELRQKARQTLFNKRRNQNQSIPQQQTPTTSSTGVKQRLGVAPVRGRGRGQVRGRGRGGSQAVGGGAKLTRPGAQLKNIRYVVDVYTSNEFCCELVQYYPCNLCIIFDDSVVKSNGKVKLLIFRHRTFTLQKYKVTA